jgi:Fe-S cluster assembly iron-binding protein IscA
MPQVNFTQSAVRELQLILENDFTLSGKYLRVLISGKGCEGFTYSVGFTDLAEEDFLVPVTSESNDELMVAMDPFTAFYVPRSTINFIQDPSADREGFIIENHAQNEFSGKFWRKAPEKTPPLVK